MASTPVAVPSPEFTPSELATLNQPVEAADLRIRLDDGSVNPRYAHVAPETITYAERLPEKRSLRLVNCWTCGTVYLECERGHMAKAHPNLCHDPGCPNCGTARARLHVWLSRRDDERILSEEGQFGVAITIPEACSRAAWIKLYRAKRWVDFGSGSSTVWHARSSSYSAEMRIAVHGSHLNYHDIRARILKQLPDATVTLDRKMEPVHLLRWTFCGAESLLTSNGAERFRLLACLPSRVIRSSGRFYRALTKAEARERKAARDAEASHTCHMCREEMRAIPLEERTKERVEILVSRYGHIDWSSDRPERYRYNRDHSTKSVASGAPSAISEAPPPRYGPN